MATDDLRVDIFVEQLPNGRYEVVTQKDGKPWLRHGPFGDLDVANMICREMIKRAERLRDRLAPPPDNNRNANGPPKSTEQG